MKKNLQVIASYTLMEAFRNRLLYIIAIFIALTIGASLFAGGLSIIEVNETQSQVLGLIYRFGSVIICSLLVISGANREFNDKNHELILSTAVTRTQYFIGKLIGYYLVGLLMCLAIAVTLLFFANYIAVAAWATSLFAEVIIMTTSALMFATIINNLTLSIILQFGFYILSRSMGAIVMMANSNPSDSATSGFIGNIIETISYVIPQLHKFANSDWLTGAITDYGSMSFILLQALIFSSLLIAISIFDFSRKNI